VSSPKYLVFLAKSLLTHDAEVECPTIEGIKYVLTPLPTVTWQTWPIWLAADLINNIYHDRAPFMLLNAAQFANADDNTIAEDRKDWYDAWPVTLKLIENLQQGEYWNVHVAKNGKEAFKSYKIIGRRVHRKDHPEGEPILTTAYKQWAKSMDKATAAGAGEMRDGAERDTFKRYYVRNYLRMQHERVLALRYDKKDLETYDE
jgi:hypothetical protein